MSTQTLYIVGRDVTLHISPGKAYKAWGKRDDDWVLETYELKDGSLYWKDTIHEYSDIATAEFYKKVVLADRIAKLETTIADAQKDLADAQAELTKK